VYVGANNEIYLNKVLKFNPSGESLIVTGTLVHHFYSYLLTSYWLLEGDWWSVEYGGESKAWS